MFCLVFLVEGECLLHLDGLFAEGDALAPVSVECLAQHVVVDILAVRASRGQCLDGHDAVLHEPELQLLYFLCLAQGLYAEFHAASLLPVLGLSLQGDVCGACHLLGYGQRPVLIVIIGSSAVYLGHGLSLRVAEEGTPVDLACLGDQSGSGVQSKGTAVYGYGDDVVLAVSLQDVVQHVGGIGAVHTLLSREVLHQHHALCLCGFHIYQSFSLVDLAACRQHGGSCHQAAQEECSCIHQFMVFRNYSCTRVSHPCWPGCSGTHRRCSCSRCVSVRSSAVCDGS